MRKWIAPIFHSSGGILYHLKSLRYGSTLWKDHFGQVNQFLKAWNTPPTTILLVGPSAGYSLPTLWLKRFKKIRAIEPDLVARHLFEIKHQVRVEWITEPLLIENQKSLSKSALHGIDSILFCNVLGQLNFNDVSKARKNLLKWSQNKNWASFHDILSGEGFHFEGSGPSDREKKWSLEKLKERIRPAKSQRVLHVDEHAAFELFEESELLEFRYWDWKISPGQTQIIEGCFSLFPKPERL